MPFHDIALLIEGEAANDFAHHFVHLWNNAKLDKYGLRNKHKQPSITPRHRIRDMFSKVLPRRWQRQPGPDEENEARSIKDHQSEGNASFHYEAELR